MIIIPYQVTKNQLNFKVLFSVVKREKWKDYDKEEKGKKAAVFLSLFVKEFNNYTVNL